MIPRRGSPPPPPREQATEQAGEQAGEPSGPTSLTPEQEHDKALRASGALNNGTASGSYDAASGGSTDEAVTATVAEAGASSGSGGEGPGMGAAEAALAGVREPGAHYPTHRFPGGPNNGVIRQLLALGEAHVGYGALQVGRHNAGCVVAAECMCDRANPSNCTQCLGEMCERESGGPTVSPDVGYPSQDLHYAHHESPAPFSKPFADPGQAGGHGGRPALFQGRQELQRHRPLCVSTVPWGVGPG